MTSRHNSKETVNFSLDENSVKERADRSQEGSKKLLKTGYNVVFKPLRPKRGSPTKGYLLKSQTERASRDNQVLVDIKGD